MKENMEFKNLYKNPRLLYKYYPISKEYAIKLQMDDGFAFLFTPNISKEELVKNKENEVIDKWRAIALDGMIFYTSPAFFNDPFDAVLPSAPEVVPTLEERKVIIEKLKELHHVKGAYQIKKEYINRLLYSDDFDKALMIVLGKIGLDSKKRTIWYEIIKKSVKRYREEIAIACFSEIKNSQLMWAHYANSYEGFCIEYDFTKSKNVSFLKGIGKVIYTDNRAKKDTSNDDYFLYEKQILCNKSKCWAYEKEWRSIDIIPYADYTNKNYPIVNAKECINAIYLGCKMPKEYQEEIAKYYKNTEIKVYQMKLKEDVFDFYFEEFII